MNKQWKENKTVQDLKMEIESTKNKDRILRGT